MAGPPPPLLPPAPFLHLPLLHLTLPKPLLSRFNRLPFRYTSPSSHFSLHHPCPPLSQNILNLRVIDLEMWLAYLCRNNMYSSMATLQRTMSLLTSNLPGDFKMWRSIQRAR